MGIPYNVGRYEPSYWNEMVFFNGDPARRADVQEHLFAKGVSEEYIARFQDSLEPVNFYRADQPRGNDGRWTSDASAEAMKKSTRSDAVGHASKAIEAVGLGTKVRAGQMLQDHEIEKAAAKLVQGGGGYHALSEQSKAHMRGLVRDAADNMTPGEDTPHGRVLHRDLPSLAHALHNAMDAAYHYGPSAPGSFGEAATHAGVKAFMKAIPKTNDIEKLAEAMHEGWGEAAKSFPNQSPEQKARRAKLANTKYGDLSEEEKEKDRVAARAMLTAVRPAAHWGGPNQPYWRPGVNKTVDNVITRNHPDTGKLQVLLIRRGKKSPAEAGKWALPGGFHDSHAAKGSAWQPGKESPEEASLRELKEETGLDAVSLKANMKHVGEYSTRGRDPRDNPEAQSVSNAYHLHLNPELAKKVVRGQDDADKAKWVDVNGLGRRKLAFDHGKIISDALGLKQKTAKSEFAMKYNDGRMEPAYWAEMVYFNGAPATREFVERQLRGMGLNDEYVAQFHDSAETVAFERMCWGKPCGDGDEESKKANEATLQANRTGSVADHNDARAAHVAAREAHEKAADESFKKGDMDAVDRHDAAARYHDAAAERHMRYEGGTSVNTYRS